MYIENSTFLAKGALQNSHFSTIFPMIKRKIPFNQFEREVIELEDGDFLEVDWVRQGNPKLLLLAHGLEGGSRQRYMLFMARHFSRRGYDICAINFRSCSGRMNRTPRLYHSGDISDFSYLLSSLSNDYHQIDLAGFSMGGNVILRYLGFYGDKILSNLRRAIVFSVPVDLGDCSEQLAKGFNKVYTEYFLMSLRKKVDHLNQNYPELNLHPAKQIKSFLEFDSNITAPMFNYKSAEDYYCNASSLPLLKHIEIETLLVNAANDPFLGKKCFPVDLSKKHSKFHLEIPSWGGHVGFFADLGAEEPWYVQRADEFLIGA